ncbi:MAG: ComF family protein [Oligoflexia bacterium]|nr:ComF family protein [Oligoflexia bacterium]
MIRMRCRLCNRRLPGHGKINENLCPCCGAGMNPVLYAIKAGSGLEVIILFAYNGTAREILRLYKFSSHINLSHAITGILLEHLDFSFEPDAIVPIPSHVLDEIKRGYSHMICIAHKMSVKTGIPFRNVLGRKIFPVFGRNQKKKKRKQRMENIERYYVKNRYSGCITGKRILLIDDVYTTGTTVNECARLLLEAGAEKVVACCFALSPM